LLEFGEALKSLGGSRFTGVPEPSEKIIAERSAGLEFEFLASDRGSDQQPLLRER
jgi:hypothetical protein